MSGPRILIVGGGIGGLTAALALRQAGFEPLVFEQARVIQPVGGGIQMSPNATRVLLQLGCGEGLRDIASAPEAIEARSWRSGRPIFSIPMGERGVEAYGAPFYQLHRADLHELLLRALGPERVRLSARCRGVVEEDDGVRVDFEDGSSQWGDLLIGADGIRSAVRNLVFGPEQPRFSGNAAFRAVVPAERVAHLPLGHNSTVWWGPKRHFVHYFISGGRLLNFVAVVPSPAWRLESWSAEGRREELAAEFAGWHPMLQEIIGATDRVMKWALYDRDPMPRWIRGRVVLLGDAAHAMLPFQGQGAAQAIEDAMVLASCLARHASEPGVGLLEYERLRKTRASRIQQASRSSERLFQLALPPLVQLRDSLLRTCTRHRPEMLSRRMNWLFAHDARAAAAAS